MIAKEEKPISREMVFLNQDISTKQEVLDLLVNNAKALNLIRDGVSFLEAVQKREEEASTSVGYQVAIPHGKSQVVTRPFIGFVQVKDEFSWNEGETEKVKLVFLIGVPEDNESNIHLKFISQLSRKLLDDEFRNKLSKIQDSEKAYQILDLINDSL